MNIFSEKELAAHFGLSPWTVRGWRIKSGLPYFKIGSRIFYRLDAVENWVKTDEMRNATVTSDGGNKSSLIVVA